ncbi:DJ-1/PfpI family protein [uncultured Treponema sp.]|uniref:DJ-1/PfpI family protein n=1 Tax=uncultured Treponema sp. TaxID=162155 RepID=UPI00260C9965|nr:DJ-1/PfpI family protein [uncultured Treponema sp.]
MKINILLFDKFETLDAFGPAEILGKAQEFELEYFSVAGGIVTSSQNVSVVTKTIIDAEEDSVWLIPGGEGTRTLVLDADFLLKLKQLAQKSKFCLSVCTGSALLAKCGALDGIRATSNKRAFEWVKTTSKKTLWIEKARWIACEKFYTSSGISAGMDMALGFVSDILGKNEANEIAKRIEYVWNDNPEKDDFSAN